MTWATGQPGATLAIHHLDAFGNGVFPSGPMIVDPAVAVPLHLAPDGGGGAVALMVGYPPEGGQYALSSVRIGARGDLMWTTPVWQGPASDDFDWARVMPDAHGNGVTLVWNSGRYATSVIYAQRLDAAGQPMWSVSRVVASLSSMLHLGVVASDGLGGCWVAFTSGSPQQQLRLQHLDRDGAPAWPDVGTLVEPSYTYIDAYDASADGAGGLYVSYNSGDSQSDHIQRVRFDGSLAFGAHGMLPPGPQGQRVLSPSFGGQSGGQLVVAWQAEESIYNWCTRVQMLDSTGTWRWPGDGVLAARDFGAWRWTRIYANPDGGATVTVHPLVDTYGVLCAAQRFSASGTKLWPEPAPALMVQADPNQTRYNEDNWCSLPTGDGGVMFLRTLEDSGAGIARGPDSVRVQHLDGYGRLGDTSPRIVSLLDAPADPGGWLQVRWHASSLEGDADMATTGYEVLRRQPDGEGAESWVVVATQPATGKTEYVAPVPTLADSTSPTSPLTVIRVRAQDASGRTWLSPPDSASSFTNAPPLAVGPRPTPSLALAAPEPTPATGISRIRYTLPAGTSVLLAVYDATGRRIRTLARGPQAAGEHVETLQADSGSDGPLAPGLYFVRLQVPGRTLARRLVVVR